MIAFVCHLRLVWVAQLWGYGREFRFWCRAFGVRELNLGVQRNGFWCLCRWLNSCCRSIQRCLLSPIVEFTQHWVSNSSCLQILGKLICMSAHARAWIYISEFYPARFCLTSLIMFWQGHISRWMGLFGSQGPRCAAHRRRLHGVTWW
jgi:hypothetical protein